MARNVTYEVYVRQGGRWEIHTRHGAAEREASINEAKSLVKMPKIDGVRVVWETHDTDDGSTEETTIYKDAIEPSSRPLAYSMPPRPTQPPRTPGGRKAPDPPSRGGAVPKPSARPERRTRHPRSGPPPPDRRQPKPDSSPNFCW